MNQIKLSKDFSMPAIDYAGQGNAILGIRDAGKTYTAMKVAEELMDSGIPIIVYDPVGVWKNLKIGTGKNKGYPIVTAGGEESDIHLTIHNAADIVRAAMKENISLVIDLYSPELINKSTWIKIVQETVDLLMYENKNHGMRHIFIEEAAEFIPQHLQPQHARVYASIERLARMGRNARMGYTIINQRAEEINKAILEISSMSLLHKQVGKNSLLSITKWLDVLQLENKNEVVKSLPNLKQGQCWVVGTDRQPFLIQVDQRKTFHPDPKRSLQAQEVSKRKIDVTAWVEKLNKLLIKPIAKKNTPVQDICTSVSKTDNFVPENGEIEQLRTENELLTEEKRQYQNTSYQTGKLIKQYQDLLRGIMAKIEKEIPDQANAIEVSSRLVLKPVPKPTLALISMRNPTGVAVTGGAMRMLKAAAMFYPKPISKVRMAALARLSYRSGSFSTYLSTLKRESMITADGNNYSITETGLQQASDVDPLPTDPMKLVELWCEIIGSQGGAARMLRVLSGKYPQSLSRVELGSHVEMSHSSGSFSTYLSTLKRNGLIKIEGGEISAADELFN